MEEYKPPKMFPDLSTKIKDKVASGEWKKLKKGKVSKSQEIPTTSAQENIPAERESVGRADTRREESYTETENISVKSGDVFRNPQDGSRIVVERVSGGMVHAIEYGPAPGKSIVDRRISPLHNFQVHVRMQEMEAIDPIQDREPAFYEEYEKQVKILGNAFSREFFACEKTLDTWEESLSSKDESIASYLLTRIRLLRHRMDEIADEWESTDGRLVHGGHRYGALLDELKSFSQKELDVDEELSKWKKDALVFLQSEYGILEPDTIHIERGYFRDVLHSKMERLLAKCRRVKSGKLKISDEVSSLPEFEREIKRLSASIVGYDPQNVDAESTVVEIKNVLDALTEMDRVAFQTETNGNGKGRVQSKEKSSLRQKKPKEEKSGDSKKRKIASSAKKNGRRGNTVVNVGAGDVQAPIAEDVIAAEEAPTEQLASYRQFLEEEQRGRTALIDLADHATIETVFSYDIDPATGKETKKKIFLPVPDDAQQIADSMSKSSQREARLLWTEMNSDLEALYLGRKFILTLESVQESWQEKISQADNVASLKSVGRNGKKAREFISIDPKDDAEEFQPLRDVLRQMIDQRNHLPKDTDRPGFSKLFDGQLKPLIITANKELTSLWQDRLQELNGKTEVIPFTPQELRASEKITRFFEEVGPIIEKNFASEGGLKQALKNDPEGVYAYLQSMKMIVDDLARAEVGQLSIAQSRGDDIARVAEEGWFKFLAKSIGLLLENKDDK